MTKIMVVAYPKASVLQDGSLVEMELQGSDKGRVTLQFEPEALDQFLARAMQLVADARSKKHAMSGHPSVPALATAGTGAGPVAGGSHVVVFLRTNTGIDYHFAVPTNRADRFAADIAAAATEARKQAAQTRQ